MPTAPRQTVSNALRMSRLYRIPTKLPSKLPITTSTAPSRRTNRLTAFEENPNERSNPFSSVRFSMLKTNSKLVNSKAAMMMKKLSPRKSWAKLTDCELARSPSFLKSRKTNPRLAGSMAFLRFLAASSFFKPENRTAVTFPKRLAHIL